MTIHRALSELKLIDAKIAKQTDEFFPVGIYQKGGLIQNHIKPEDFSAMAQSKFDSVTDLIRRKKALKSAIVASNGVTKVTVAGIDMTVADAINNKNAIDLQKLLLARMKGAQQACIAQLNKNNDAVQANVQRLLEVTFGKENVKVEPKDMNAVRGPYIEANTWLLYDPLDVTKKIEELETYITAFEADVDAALSEINAVTFIEIAD